MNHDAIDEGINGIVKVNVPLEWSMAEDEKLKHNENYPEFIKEIVKPMNRLEGDSIPVSTFIKLGMKDGTFMHGTTAYEKRGIAIRVPEWIPERCIQCNQCSYVCPHATIRPFLLNDEEKANAPDKFKSIVAKGLKSA